MDAARGVKVTGGVAASLKGCRCGFMERGVSLWMRVFVFI